mgnify:CR=1 FL=1
MEYEDEWFYGSQTIVSSQMDNTNWGAQKQKCIDADYKIGGEVFVDVEVVDTISESLTSCNGKMAESGGRFRILAVEPDAPVATFTDDDILVTSSQTFTPFMNLSNAVNGISAVYPSPSEGWQNQTAPPLIRKDLEKEDDNRRMISDVELPFVTDDEQVQRIMKTALDEARRAKKHNHTLPPNFWQVEPLDTLEWTSAKNGYTSKRFLVDGIVDTFEGDEIFDLTETDPSDYVWNSQTDFTPIVKPPIISPVPSPQQVEDWSVASEFLYDPNGNASSLGIRMSWEGNVTNVDNLVYQIRLQSSEEVILEGINLDVESGSRLVTKDFKLDTIYEVRAKYTPSSDRLVEWTPWTVVEESPSSEPSVQISDFLRLQGETLVTSMKIEVASDSVFYKKAQVRWKLNEIGESFSSSTDGPIGDFTVPIVEDGKEYVIEVTLIGADGQSANAFQYNHMVEGKNAKPNEVTNLFINAHGEVSTLSWTPPSDLDISHYKIRHCSKTSGAKYSDSQVLVEKVSRPATSFQVPTLNGTYFVRTFDKSGNASEDVASVSLFDNSSFLRGMNVVELVEEHPDFTGSKTNCTISDNDGSKSIQLSGALNFDDASGNFDDLTGQFDASGGAGVVLLGYYEFGQTDLGQKFHCKLSPKFTVSRLGFSNLFDGVAGNFDSISGQFDGSSDIIDEIDFTVQVSYTDDDPSGSPNWSNWSDLHVSENQFRACKFRGVLKTTNNLATPKVSDLSVSIDMPDREETGSDITFTGSKDIVFSKSFKVVPTVGITVQNIPDSQRPRVYNKTENGFSVEILNGLVQSTNEVTMDYTAKGYGETE